jgi:hypothetical protein
LIEPLNDITQASASLKRYEETSQFLISNLRDLGPVVTNNPYSGNFKAIKRNYQIVAIFSIPHCGNIYAQADSAEHTDLILAAYKAESFPIKGFLGSWSILAPIFEKFFSENSQFKPFYNS